MPIPGGKFLLLRFKAEVSSLQRPESRLEKCVLAPGNANPRISGLLGRVADGEATAMSECIDCFGTLVWGIVFRRVRDLSAAEDLVQEIFTDTWRHAGRYDPMVASESAFVAMIARRKVIDWLRKQARQPRMMPLDEMADLPDSLAAAPGIGLDHKLILATIAELPEETRRLFRLHFEEGMSHSEIAEQTGLPLGSVKTRLRRGLIEARTLVARLGESANPPLGELA